MTSSIDVFSFDYWSFLFLLFYVNYFTIYYIHNSIGVLVFLTMICICQDYEYLFIVYILNIFP